METWLPVVGYEGHYEVSDHGRVRSLNRWIPQQNRTYRGRVLRPGNDRYLFVILRKNGVSTNRRVHALVLEAFAGPRPPGAEALHGPGGKLDNRWPENLKWGTSRQNKRDQVRDGTAWWTDDSRRDAVTGRRV